MKYKGEMDRDRILVNIANELAETNRLTRIQLKSMFLQSASNILYKQATDASGKPIILEPTEEDKKDYHAEVKAIADMFADHNGKMEKEPEKPEEKPEAKNEQDPKVG